MTTPEPEPEKRRPWIDLTPLTDLIRHIFPTVLVNVITVVAFTYLFLLALAPFFKDQITAFATMTGGFLGALAMGLRNLMGAPDKSKAKPLPAPVIHIHNHIDGKPVDDGKPVNEGKT